MTGIPAIRTGFVRGFREPHAAAEFRDARRNAQIVGGDDDFRHDRRRLGAPIHVLDHRTAVEIGECLAGEPGRRVSGGDEGDDS